jgi:hypothetical protein
MAKLKCITRTSLGHYRVELEEPGTAAIVAFDFVVDGEKIEVVHSPEEFAVYISMKFSRVTPLLRAIGAFHEAQKLEFP